MSELILPYVEAACNSSQSYSDKRILRLVLENAYECIQDKLAQIDCGNGGGPPALLLVISERLNNILSILKQDRFRSLFCWMKAAASAPLKLIFRNKSRKVHIELSK